MRKLYKLFWLLPLLLSLQTFSQSNQYLHFDKVDDFVVLENASQYFSGTTQLSITGWFYCDALAYGQGYMGFRIGSGTAEFYLIQLNNGVMECRLKTTSGLYEYVAPANTAIPQVWQHLAWIYDGTSIKLYVNGALKGSATATGVFQGANVPFGIGKSILGGFNFVYGGRIDEVSAWNKALTQAEVQDLMENELTGNETGLQLYYKFNQGEPGGNNTSITKLICEVGSGERDADLMNFALTGPTSNFNGTLNPGYQAISFPQIPNHLTSDPPFNLEATATSGLPVQFEVVSGPATLNGTLLTLTGNAGEVVIKATQPGNGTYDPADPVFNTFMVIDPKTNVPEIDARNPLPGNVYVSSLNYIQLATFVTIPYPDLFSVQEVKFTVNGQTLYPTNWGNGYYSGWWAPPSYGSHIITITAKNNFGAMSTQNVSINVVNQATNLEIQAAENIWVSTATPSIVVDAELPSFLDAFGQITASLELTCPTGGCGEWDRVASIDARGHDGKWVEIIRYITPYGVPCNHSLDVTDFMSILQGKISLRFNCATLDNGYLWSLAFNYNTGTPAFKYSKIDIIWQDTYQFGDYANLQPVEMIDYSFPENALAATMKLVSTGHGWGNLNTGNAAEFHDDTHHIHVNGVQTFEQHNWQDCNPNPDGCQPQNGTWYYDRAGWCPGAIAHWFDFNMTPYVQQENVQLKYVFDQDYVDLCHPNHPDCVTGVTCTDCDDGFNPHLVVACNLVSFGNIPLDEANIVGIDESYFNLSSYIALIPNPSASFTDLEFYGESLFDKSVVRIETMAGKTLQSFAWNGEKKTIDLTGMSKGVYFVIIESEQNRAVKKLIVQ